METKEILFLLVTLMIVIHEARKIKDARYIFDISKKFRTKEIEMSKIHEYEKYRSILGWDTFEFLVLIVGVFFSQYWYCFLAIIILSFSKMQTLGIRFFILDAILTMGILLFTIINRILLMIMI
jgi:hypothetical protein